MARLRGLAPVTVMLALAAPGFVTLAMDANIELDCASGAQAGAPPRDPGTERASISPSTSQTERPAPRRTHASRPPHFTVAPPRCEVPRMAIEPTDGCAAGLPYPACTWQLPSGATAGRLYRVWRNTSDDHRHGRPALVALVLAAADEYARLYPGEKLAIGDLDAAGPRHNTHDRGVDVDIYLPGAMEVENLGGGELADNYAGLTPFERTMRRSRVEALARVLAECAAGRVRILYNDPAVRRPFNAWWRSREDLTTPFGAPMQGHNELHRFHFHVTVPDDLAVLPFGDAPGASDQREAFSSSPDTPNRRASSASTSASESPRASSPTST